MILWKLTFREIRLHPGRAILTTASIVIGIAAVVAVNLAAATVRTSFRAMHAAVAGSAALEVEAAGGGLFEEGLTDVLADVPGVLEAAPVYERVTVMYFGEERVNLVLLGIDARRHGAVRDYTVAEGEMFTAGDHAVFDLAFARGLGIHVGDEVRLFGRRGRFAVKVVGLLQPQSGAAVGRNAAIFLPLATAQRRYALGGNINRIQIVLEEGADRAAVEAAIARRLPTGLSVHVPAVQTQMAEETMLFLQWVLRLGTWSAVLAAAFIIGNAFFMNVTQRRRQLAILRAIGASRRQIALLICREAWTLATAGTVIGLAAGWGGAILLSLAMEQLFGTELSPPALNFATAGLAVLIGFVVAILGVGFPALKAALVTPLEGMHEITSADVEGIPAWFAALGIAGWAASLGLLGLHLAGMLPGYNAVAGAIASLVLAVPVVAAAVGPLARTTTLLLRPWVGIEGRLAHRQLMRRRIRAVLVLGVLLIASSTGFGLANTVLDELHDLEAWQRHALVGDYFLRAMTPDLASWELAEMPEELEEQVRALPGVETMFTTRFVRGEAEGLEVMIIAREYPSDDMTAVDPKVIAPALLRQKMHEGEVTIGSVLAQRTGLKEGDSLEIQTREGPKRMPIAAVENNYMGGGLTVHLERRFAARLLGVKGADAFVIRTRPDQSEAVRAELEKIAKENGLLLQSYAEITRMIDNMISGVTAGLWVVMILGLLVAALGVTNTLSMNVWEQTRELAMLRAIAMTRGQTRRTVVAQAAILGAIGLTPGVLLGAAVAWIINRALVQIIGHTIEFHLHPVLAIAGLAVAMVLVLLAAWLPAHRAANLEPIQALRYE